MSVEPVPIEDVPGIQPATRPWVNRNFSLLWVGQAISSIGDLVFDITLLLWIAAGIGAGHSWAPLAVSGELLCVFGPDVLGGPIAGVFVDRWDKRRTMLVMDALRAGLVMLLLLASQISGLPAGVQLGMIYLTVFLTTLCNQFFMPSRMALIGDIVHKSDVERTSGMLQLTGAIASIIGPPLAPPLFFAFGVQWALGVNALSFVASFVAIWFIAAPPAARSVAVGQQGDMTGELLVGLRYFFGNPVLRTVLIATLVAVFGSGMLNALDYFFVVRNLHASPHLYGLISAGFAAGTIIGALISSMFAARIGAIRLFWFGLLAGGVGILIYSRMTSFAPALILLALIGIPVSGVNIALMPIMLQSAPRDLIGRVSGVMGPILSMGSIASIVLSGILASTLLNGFHATILGIHFGPIDTLFTATGILAIIAGLYAWSTLRKIGHASP